MIPFPSLAPCSIGIQAGQGIVVSERATHVGGGTLKPPADSCPIALWERMSPARPDMESVMAFDGEVEERRDVFPREKRTTICTIDEENAGHVVIGAISVIN